jgi:hypothetical protein
MPRTHNGIGPRYKSLWKHVAEASAKWADIQFRIMQNESRLVWERDSDLDTTTQRKQESRSDTTKMPRAENKLHAESESSLQKPRQSLNSDSSRKYMHASSSSTKHLHQHDSCAKSTSTCTYTLPKGVNSWPQWCIDMVQQDDELAAIDNDVETVNLGMFVGGKKGVQDLSLLGTPLGLENGRIRDDQVQCLLYMYVFLHVYVCVCVCVFVCIYTVCLHV